jgi:hypothetical protein
MLPAVSTVVTVMDREGPDANTDVIVLVEPSRRRLLWIPRDVWCPALGDRVNAAFKLGGHDALIGALAELRVRADRSVCVSRPAAGEALRGLSVQVPVSRSLALRYPLAPEQPIEDGEKLVRFDPPAEILQGERIHQWIGARFELDRPSSDLERIARQQVFVRALLEQGFDLGAVKPTWTFSTLPRLRPATIDGKSVLVHHPWWRPSRRYLRGSSRR